MFQTILLAVRTNDGPLLLHQIIYTHVNFLSEEEDEGSKFGFCDRYHSPCRSYTSQLVANFQYQCELRKALEAFQFVWWRCKLQ